MAKKNINWRGMAPVLAGYMPKRTMRGEEWMREVPFKEVCSVSNCMSKEPEGWIDSWIHNELWCFDTPKLAKSMVVPEELPQYDLYAFKLFPVLFKDGHAEWMKLPTVEADPLGEMFECLGHDAQSSGKNVVGGCSPLSCNYMWQHAVVNTYCLVDDRQAAMDLARRFSIEKPEPGDYIVFEVWRHRQRDGWWRALPG
jgi:hypothetical protein